LTEIKNSEGLKKKIKVLVIVGPTASGKTKLAVSLAKIFDGEVVSADSMQVYKEMNIGTAKITFDEMQNIPHYLIDFLPIDEEFSVADFVKLAKEKIFNISEKNKLPIICGGTGLYINSLIDNVDFTVKNYDNKVRVELEERLKSEGIESLTEELKRVDPQAFMSIHKNNTKRIIRALEIYKTSGINKTEQMKISKNIESPFEPFIIGLTYKDREKLYERINKRVDLMLEKGLLEECKKILSKKCSKTALNAICYKEFIPYFNGEISLDVAVENLKRGTRKYAKRQLTWFKKDKRINWVYVDEYDNLGEIAKLYTKKLDSFLNM